jgi:hypothetical protein
VTEKASIAGRSLFVTLLALALALVFVATSAGDADAKRVRHKHSTAAFINCVDRDAPTPCAPRSEPFTPPDRFTCRYLDVGVPLDPAQGDAPSLDGYRCTAGTTTFLLNDVLFGATGPPPGPGPLDGVADPPPDLFKCRSDGNVPSLPTDDDRRGEILADHFNCQYRQNQQTRVFKVNEIVSTTVDVIEPLAPGEVTEDDVDEVFLPPVGRAVPTPTPTPKPTPKPTATKTPAAVPTAVPAGTDAAGGGSAAGLVGLVLAAGGAVAGGAVMARRRFMHDS